MKGITTEIKVGAAVLLGGVVLSFMSFKVGGFTLWREEGYHLEAIFASASGVDEKSQVRVMGVDVGQVAHISLVEEGAKVSLKIRPGIVIRKGGYAVVRASGLLGDHHIEIVPGQGPNYYQEGDLLPAQAEVPSVENMMTRFADIAEDIKAVSLALRDIFATQEGKKSFDEIVLNTRGMTRLIYDFVDDNKGSLGRSLDNIETFSESLKDQSDHLLQSLNHLVMKVERGEGTLGKLISDEATYNKLTQSLDELNRTLKSVQTITKKVEQGEGTIGKLFSDDKAYENFNSAVEGIGNAVRRIERLKTYVGFRGEHQIESGENKGYFSLRLQPRTDKYYLFEVVDDPQGRVTQEDKVITVNGVSSTTRELHTDRGLKFSAQFGRRMANLGLRVGLMENSFGLGTDYFLDNDKVSFSVDAWDFNSVDPDASRTHLKLSTAYTLMNHIRFEVGYDQILNPQRDTYYVGAGLQLEDEDIKYLLGSLSGLVK